MIRIAVTGGIGSGKSVVCKVFETIGTPVFYADNSAKEIIKNDQVVKNKLISYFGSTIFDENRNLIRSKFAEIIFNDKDALLIVNNIIHPIVREKFEEWAKIQNAPYVIEEAAIVFESGIAHLFDKIICVTAPLEMRIERVMCRDRITHNEVLERMKNQESNELKIAKSDFVILNDNKEMILPQIIKIHNKLI